MSAEDIGNRVIAYKEACFRCDTQPIGCTLEEASIRLSQAFSLRNEYSVHGITDADCIYCALLEISPAVADNTQLDTCLAKSGQERQRPIGWTGVLVKISSVLASEQISRNIVDFKFRHQARIKDGLCKRAMSIKTQKSFDEVLYRNPAHERTLMLLD